MWTASWSRMAFNQTRSIRKEEDGSEPHILCTWLSSRMTPTFARSFWCSEQILSWKILGDIMPQTTSRRTRTQRWLRSLNGMWSTKSHCTLLFWGGTSCSTAHHLEDSRNSLQILSRTLWYRFLIVRANGYYSEVQKTWGSSSGWRWQLISWLASHRCQTHAPGSRMIIAASYINQISISMPWSCQLSGSQGKPRHWWVRLFCTCCPWHCLIRLVGIACRRSTIGRSELIPCDSRNSIEFRTWQLRTVSIHCTEKLLMPASRGWRTLRDKYALAPRDESGELTKGDTSSQFEPYRFIQMSATAWWKIWFSFTLQEACIIWDSPMGLFLFIFHQDPFPGYQSACKLDKDG